MAKYLEISEALKKEIIGGVYEKDGMKVIYIRFREVAHIFQTHLLLKERK